MFREDWGNEVYVSWPVQLALLDSILGISPTLVRPLIWLFFGFQVN